MLSLIEIASRIATTISQIQLPFISSLPTEAPPEQALLIRVWMTFNSDVCILSGNRPFVLKLHILNLSDRTVTVENRSSPFKLTNALYWGQSGSVVDATTGESAL